MAKETFNYGKLIAGETNYIIKVPCTAGTYKVGDVLEFATDSNKFSKSTVDATEDKSYVVCNEDVTADEGGEVVCIKEGYFNEHVIKINDLAVTDKSKVVLLTKNIFVTKVQEA